MFHNNITTTTFIVYNTLSNALKTLFIYTKRKKKLASWNFHSHNLFTAGWNQTIPYNKLFWAGSWPSYGVQKGPIYGTTTDLYTKLNSFKWLTISIYPDFVCQVHCTRGKGTCFLLYLFHRNEKYMKQMSVQRGYNFHMYDAWLRIQNRISLHD